MRIKIIMVGKTVKPYLIEGINEYLKRLKKYITVEQEIIADIKNKNLTKQLQKQKEGTLILKRCTKTDYIVLLDDKGKMRTSNEFARFLQEKMNSSVKNIVFIIGGPYGFSQEVYNRGNEMFSLSRLTFSHQMIRLIFLEQLYRANTILKGEPYHHD
ncbi:MAG: 23S rRNA (pseudouridine(1915)-N(3))-methyltransferase RlmH [Chlorobi bacterium]|nr:23S rRNA (pseudouridine(1915)-N(3))-methyltransferase RlmH [Chlorobiota bacterium]